MIELHTDPRTTRFQSDPPDGGYAAEAATASASNLLATPWAYVPVAS